MKMINENGFSKTLSTVEILVNVVVVCSCGRTKTELLENAEVTLSVPIHYAQYYKLIQYGRTGASLSCRLYLGLFQT